MHNQFKLDIPFLIKENIKTNNFCNYAETKTGFCQSLTKENWSPIPFVSLDYRWVPCLVSNIFESTLTCSNVCPVCLYVWRGNFYTETTNNFESYPSVIFSHKRKPPSTQHNCSRNSNERLAKPGLALPLMWYAESAHTSGYTHKNTASRARLGGTLSYLQTTRSS